MFIEVTRLDDGGKRLINTNWITDIFDGEDKRTGKKYSIIWIGNSSANRLYYVFCRESYDEIREMLMGRN